MKRPRSKRKPDRLRRRQPGPHLGPHRLATRLERADERRPRAGVEPERRRRLDHLGDQHVGVAQPPDEPTEVARRAVQAARPRPCRGSARTPPAPFGAACSPTLSWCGPSSSSLSATTTMLSAICARQSRSTSRATVSTVASDSTAKVAARRGAGARPRLAPQQPVAERRLVHGREADRPALEQLLAPGRRPPRPRRPSARSRPRAAAGARSPARISPSSSASSTSPPPGGASRSTIRLTRVSKTGESGAPSAASDTAASAPSASGPSSTSRPPGAGRSLSRCEKKPPDAVPPALQLDRLHPAAPDPAQPERHPGRRQRLARRVVVDRDQRLGPARRPPHRRRAPDAGEAARGPSRRARSSARSRSCVRDRGARRMPKAWCDAEFHDSVIDGESMADGISQDRTVGVSRTTPPALPRPSRASRRPGDRNRCSQGGLRTVA